MINEISLGIYISETTMQSQWTFPESFVEVNPLDPVVAVGLSDSEGTEYSFACFFLKM